MSSLSLHNCKHTRGCLSGCGFWGSQSERCFVYVRVFNPYAPSNKCSSLATAYKKHENIKRHAYGQWIWEVKHASFTPLVMSATGGLAHEATTFYKCLASLLPTKWGIAMPSLWDYYAVASLFCCSGQLSFVSVVFGCHPVINRTPPPMDLESRLMD